MNNICMKKLIFLEIVVASFLFLGCGRQVQGPDKQFAGSLGGAISGAGSGAVTGFQLGSAAGPAAAVGAGIGAVAGGIQGAGDDLLEEKSIRLSQEMKGQREESMVQRILTEHYRRRMALHPGRDIYPSDFFFTGDGATITEQGDLLLKALANLNKNKRPWSRIAVAAYQRSNDENASFARLLARKRSVVVGDKLVRYGIEPRRIETRAVVIFAPVLIDPDDNPERYNQAIEFISLDK